MSSNWPPHHLGLEDLGAALRRSFRHHNTSKKRYRMARVLCVYFQQDGTQHLQVGSTSERVRDAFSRLYGYDAVCFPIPKGNNPTEALADALRQLVQGMGDDCLAILHYIGHSAKPKVTADNPNGFHIKPTPVDDVEDDDSGNGSGKHPTIAPNDSIDFLKLRGNILDISPANVLMLLDCCHAASGGICQRKELIAACNFESQCGGGEAGFSSQLVHVLQHAHDRGQILSTAALFNRLATKHFELKNGIPKLAAMPVFLQHHYDPSPALILYRMSPDTSRYWAIAPTSGTMFQPANVVLSIHFEDSGSGPVNAVGQLISDFPGAEQHIRIDHVYPSTSTLVVLTTTFKIWYTLPKNPAITFLGIEINKDASLYKGFENQNMVRPLTFEEERKLLRGPGYTEPLFKKIPE